MKFGKTGVLGLCLLGVAALILAILTPSLLSNKQDSLIQRAPADARHWPMSAKGVIESEQDVQLASTVAGQVAEVLVDEGDRVQTGQLLVRLDNGKIEAKIAAATAAVRQASARRSEVETGYRKEDIATATHAVDRAAAISSEARRTLDRQERLLTQGAVTRVTRDQANEAWLVAEADLNQAKAQLEKLQKGPRTEELSSARAEEQRARAELNYLQDLLGDYQMTSPIDGVVINRYRDPFETVDVGTPILTIVNPDKLRVWAEVEETDAGLVEEGQNVSVTVDAHPGQEYQGKVTKVYTAVQRKSQRTFDPVATFDINTQKILIALDSYDGLVHGMSATVKFQK